MRAVILILVALVACDTPALFVPLAIIGGGICVCSHCKGNDKIRRACEAVKL